MDEPLPTFYRVSEAKWDEPAKVEIKTPFRATTSKTKITFGDVSDSLVETFNYLRSTPRSGKSIGADTTQVSSPLGLGLDRILPTTTYSTTSPSTTTTRVWTTTTLSPETSTWTTTTLSPETSTWTTTPSQTTGAWETSTMPSSTTEPWPPLTSSSIEEWAEPATTMEPELPPATDDWFAGMRDIFNDLRGENQSDSSSTEWLEVILPAIGLIAIFSFLLDRILKRIYRTAYRRTMFVLLTGELFCKINCFIFGERQSSS